MTTRLLLAILALVSAGFMTVATPASAAEYCTYTTPAYVNGHPVTPAGEYCVPGP